MEYVFSKSTGNYRNKATGRKVSDRQLYGWVEDAVTRGGANLERFARQLQRGEINKAQWALSSGEEIRNMHRAVAMIANGGKAQMGPSQWGFVGSRIRSELTYFNAFASEVDNIPEGAVLTDAFVSRAKSYFNAAYTTYAQALRRRVIEASHADFEENILEAGSVHCEGCLGASAAGPVPIGTLVEIGARECGGRCRCRIVYSSED